MLSYITNKFSEILKKPLGAEIIQFYNLRPRPTDKDEFEKIYPIPLMSRLKTDKKVKIGRFGVSADSTEEINILVLGATGSGKSRAVNALINYLTNVKFEDGFRLEIVELEESERVAQSDQSQSQTDWITVYEIGVFGDSKNRLQINIVDTPGICDTSGKERDKETFEQLRNLFTHGFSQINAVCIVMNGTISRLTNEQQYIFTTIKKIFGEEITENIVIWATFTRDKQPKVLHAVRKEGFTFVKHFSFENGSLFKKIPSDKSEQLDMKRAFDSAYDTFDLFFETVKDLPSQSLENSRDVLEQRNFLGEGQRKIEGEIKETVRLLKDLKTFEKDVNEYEDLELSSRNTKIKVTLTQRCSTKVYNCTHCHRTCCPSCDHGYFQKMGGQCDAFGAWGDCKVCRCPRKNHEHSTFERYVTMEKSIFEIDEIQKSNPRSLILSSDKKSLIDTVKIYLCEAQKSSKDKINALDRLKENIGQQEQKIYDLLERLHYSIEKIKSIALYQETESVQDIILQMEKNDTQNSEAQSIYRKLNNHIIQKRL